MSIAYLLSFGLKVLGSYFIYFEEITDSILDYVSDKDAEYVKAQFKKLDDNILDHMNYWFEKYYRNGFCDAVELISGCLR